MKISRYKAVGAALLTAFVLAAPLPVRAQSADIVARILVFTNNARVANGLPPYALNPLLNLSAQRHSEYQASIQQWTHTGADGSRTLQRVQATGYPATRANENVYSGSTSPEVVANWWLTADQDHRNNMLHPVLREIGVGAAADVNGVIYFTMDISAQPNVLPIFINNDDYSTSSQNVTITLTNEGVFGGAPGQIGRASQVMISNSADFSGASTQPWAQYINWSLDGNGSGLKTVYVRYIDSSGRTADSQDSISLDGSGGSVSAPTTAPIIVPTIAPAVVVPQATSAPIIPADPQQPPPVIVPTATAIIQSPAPTEAQVDLLAEIRPQVLFAVRPNPVDDNAETSRATWLGLPIELARMGLFALLVLAIGSISIGILVRARARQIAILNEEGIEEEEDDLDG